MKQEIFWRKLKGDKSFGVFYTVFIALVALIFILAYHDAIGGDGYYLLFSFKDLSVFMLCFWLWPKNFIRSGFAIGMTILIIVLWFIVFYVVWIFMTYLVCLLFQTLASDYDAHFNAFLDFVIGSGPIGTMFSFARFSPDFMGIFILALGPKLVILALEEKMDNFKLESRNLQLELKFLRSQINPHFLFNTLNNIYLLLDFDRKKGKEMILRLTALMRYNIFESKNQVISLRKELAFIEDFLSLMRLRYGDRVKIATDITSGGSDYQIIPLLIISFVENAFKHGPDKDPANNYICISIKTEDGVLHLKIENTVQDKNLIQLSERSDNYLGGIGIANIKRRLELHYPGKYQLIFFTENSIFTVKMDIELL